MFGMTDEALVSCTENAEVEYAKGDSDAESIRDYDAPARGQWHIVDPYFYCRETNLEDMRYRRRMRPTPRSAQVLDWDVEVEADEDGYVKQQSFTRSLHQSVKPTVGETAAPVQSKGLAGGRRGGLHTSSPLRRSGPSN